MSTTSGSATSKRTAVNRQRTFRHAELATVPVVAIQEGSAIARIEASTPASSAASSSTSAAAADSDTPSLSDAAAALRITSSFLCSSCRVSFDDAADLRAHCKSQWHIHNVKVQSSSNSSSGDSANEPVSETEFEEMQQAAAAAAEADQSDSASSGSEWSDSEKDESVAERKVQQDVDVNHGSNRIQFYTPTHKLSVWKAMLLQSPSTPPSHLPLHLKCLDYMHSFRSLPSVANIAVIMLSGGRFTAAIWNGDTCISHKSFQRYTTRRKQGGTQAAHDNAKGAAKSIGSTIRRKEAVRFAEETRAILTAWSAFIAQCHRIFIFAPSANQQLLFGSNPTPLFDKNDPRIRSIPFPTYRPTLEEATRVHTWITTLEMEERDNPPYDIEVEKADESKTGEMTVDAASTSSTATAAASSAPAIAAPVPPPDDSMLNAVTAGSISDLQSLLANGYTRPIPPAHPSPRPLLYHAILHGQLDVARMLLTDEKWSHAADPNEQVVTEEFDPSSPKRAQPTAVCHTALHVACRRNDLDAIILLLEHGADPLLNDSHSRLAFSLISSAPVRMELRRWAGSTPNRIQLCNWTESGLPPLTPEVEALTEQARKEKEKARKKAQKQRAAERKAAEKAAEVTRAAQDAQMVAAAREAQSLRESAQAVREASTQRAATIAQLSDREKRALAAERRMAAMMGKGITCSSPSCGKAITGTPFERFNYKYCSSSCLQNHKRILDAQ